MIIGFNKRGWSGGNASDSDGDCLKILDNNRKTVKEGMGIH